MKTTLVLFLCVCYMALQPAVACTTFFINKNGHLVFGRNYDWISEAGLVCTNLKGLHKTSIPADNNSTAKWISKYGSITFNQYGKELPTGGMNEKGLVVELMWADGSKYPDPDGRPGLHLLQWIQYQLDNNSTVEEVIATNEKVRISPNNPPCHFLVADASGKAATIEFLKGKQVVHTGKDLPFAVLTNSTYEESARSADSVKVSQGNMGFSFQDNSLQRFSQACSMVQQIQQDKISVPVIGYAFDILGKVAVPSFTKWSIVYDLKNKKIFFKTDSYTGIKSFQLAAFDFSCPAQAMALNMNQPYKGDVYNNFQVFTDELNREIMQKAITESKSQVPITDESRDANLAYARNIKCKD